MDTPPNRRRSRTFLQNRRAQILQALLIVTYLVVYTVVLSAAAIGPTVLALLHDPLSFETAPHRAIAAANELFFFEERFWPIAIVLILVFGLHSIYMSHRIYGPLVRVRAEADLVTAGDLTRRVVFRRGDQLSDLQDSMNDMIEAMDSRISAVQIAARECEQGLRQLHEAQFTGSPAGRLVAYERMAGKFDQLSRELGELRTSASVAGERTEDGEPPQAAIAS